MWELETFMTFLKNKVNLFYILAFIPIVLVTYFNMFGAVIPLFGFLLLFLKREDLPFHVKANFAEGAAGFIVVLVSFFLYFLVVPFFFPSMYFYGAPNYIVYIFGLGLVFFGLPFFKRGFSPLFLMIAASLNYFVSELLQPYLSPYAVSFLTDLTVGILKMLGISFTTLSQGVIVLQTWNGPLPLAIIWGCVGVESMFIFSLALIVLLFEDSSSAQTKLLWSFFGLLGTFLVNVIRVTLIFITDYYYGSEAGGTVHYIIGYALFFSWLVLFLFVFSKRRAILSKLPKISDFQKS